MTIHEETASRGGGGSSFLTAGQNGFSNSTVSTRSSDIPDRLDADALTQITQMVEGGWEPGTARESWVSWVTVVAESAGDAAVAEGSWAVTP